MKRRVRHCAQAMLLVAGAAAAAAGAAAEAPYDFVVCTTGKRIPLEASADAVAFGIESWGVVASSTTTFWEQAATHCVGYLRIVGGRPLGKGMCRWTEAGGDSAVGEWEYPLRGEPTWSWLAGSGKLRGISGGGTFREVFSAKPADPNVSNGCRRDWGRFNLP